ncbi:Uncharacterised protein [Salmonella enterica subsp. enterica serovar Bovismorbificans]|nr:Uncharacterised protein [Salmonella enterica subsp. enterica serovar Bovismorbificans]
MTGTEPDAARAQKQHAFEQAMVQQVIEPAGQTQRDQYRLIESNPGNACAQTEQNDADIFLRVIGQQALNVMLHQRVQTTDKGGDHPKHQQRHAPPQRRIAAKQR